MRIITSLLLVSCISSINAQRVKFQDPELRFSFKKPSSWEIFDNGYIIKASPSVKDTSTIYLTITYFTPPKPMEGLSEEDLATLIPESSVATQFQDFPDSKQFIRLFNRKVKWKVAQHNDLELRFYGVTHLEERWEVVASAPKSRYSYYHEAFHKMVKSLKAKRKPE